MSEAELVQLPDRLARLFRKGWAQAYEIPTYAPTKKLVIGSGTAIGKRELAASLALVAVVIHDGYEGAEGKNAIKDDDDLHLCCPNLCEKIMVCLGNVEQGGRTEPHDDS